MLAGSLVRAQHPAPETNRPPLPDVNCRATPLCPGKGEGGVGALGGERAGTGHAREPAADDPALNCQRVSPQSRCLQETSRVDNLREHAVSQILECPIILCRERGVPRQRGGCLRKVVLEHRQNIVTDRVAPQRRVTVGWILDRF